MAKISAGVILGRVGPEEPGESFAAMRDCGIQEEKSEEGLRGARRNNDGRAIPSHIELPEQPHFEHLQSNLAVRVFRQVHLGCSGEQNRITPQV